jgi:hypothetical protein
MHPEYHAALVRGAVEALQRRAAAGGWTETTVEHIDSTVFVALNGRRAGDEYLAKIDMSKFPVEPYEVGFVNPRLATDDRMRVSSRDPRYWPWSPMPGLHGSFIIHYPRAIRTFWCRPCTAPFFYYHGAENRWEPGRWPLTTVVADLREAVLEAEHPRHWRAVQRATLFPFAQGRGVTLPPGGGRDDS